MAVVKLKEILNDSVIAAFKNFENDNKDFGVAHRVAVIDFAKVFWKEIQDGVTIYNQFKKKIDEKDEQTITEWNEFCEKEFDLPKLPYELFYSAAKLSPADQRLLEPFATARVPEPKKKAD